MLSVPRFRKIFEVQYFQYRCPRCDAVDFLDHGPVAIHDGTIWRTAACMTCGCRWNEVYTASHYEMIHVDGLTVVELLPLDAC